MGDRMREAFMKKLKQIEKTVDSPTMSHRLRMAFKKKLELEKHKMEKITKQSGGD